MAERERPLKDRAWTTEEVDDLEKRLDRLRSLYEMYFQGVERVEPLTLRKQVYRLVLQANPGLIHNTALRFRLRSLIQRFNVYQNYWNRVMMQIERGTYKRGRVGRKDDGPRSPHMRRRLERLLKRQGRSLPEEERASTEGAEPGGAAKGRERASEAGEPPKAQARERAVRDGAQGSGKASSRAPHPRPDFKDVYQNLITKRQACNQSVEGMTYDRIARRLAASRASIIASTGCKDVRFEVQVVNGKTKLKAIPIK